MAVGHHIGNRGHEHEKKRVKGSDIKEERRFYELDEGNFIIAVLIQILRDIAEEPFDISRSYYVLYLHTIENKCST